MQLKRTPLQQLSVIVFSFCDFFTFNQHVPLVYTYPIKNIQILIEHLSKSMINAIVVNPSCALHFWMLFGARIFFNFAFGISFYIWFIGHNCKEKGNYRLCGIEERYFAVCKIIQFFFFMYMKHICPNSNQCIYIIHAMCGKRNTEGEKERKKRYKHSHKQSYTWTPAYTRRSMNIE